MSGQILVLQDVRPGVHSDTIVVAVTYRLVDGLNRFVRQEPVRSSAVEADNPASIPNKPSPADPNNYGNRSRMGWWQMPPIPAILHSGMNASKKERGHSEHEQQSATTIGPHAGQARR